MRYYDTIETPKTGMTFTEGGENRIAETDNRVKIWFLPIPEDDNGTKLYARAFSPEGLPTLIEIVFATQAEHDLITLEQAKADKIKAIDTQTGQAIEALVGDNNKQKDLLAQYNDFLEKKIDGILTDEEIVQMTVIKEQWVEVKNLKYNGNNREATVALVELETTLPDGTIQTQTLEQALAEVEQI